jgi:hypothetical protein
MARLLADFLRGELSALLAPGGVPLDSAGLAAAPVVGSPDRLAITLDPDAQFGSPEIVHVVAHSAAATTATILRGQEGTTAREHPAGTPWVHAITAAGLAAAIPVPQTTVLSQGAGQAVATGAIGTPIAMTMDTEQVDEGGWADLAANNRRITPAAVGFYDIWAQALFNAAATTGRRQLFIRRFNADGTGALTVRQLDLPARNETAQNSEVVLNWPGRITTVGQYFELAVAHTAGATLTVFANFIVRGFVPA